MSPNNPAMKEICSGCSKASEILKKKVDFEKDLKVMGIFEFKDTDYYIKPEFNVEDSKFIEKYKERYSENEISDILRSFTKINYLRNGLNRTNFEKCKYIILTGKHIAHQLSMDLGIKNDAKDIPFATDIYFLTDRLWYKLNKGFSKSEKLPAAFDSIIKAQIVLSSLAGRSIDKKYQKLLSDSKAGKINSDEAQAYYYSLRESAKKPEDIIATNAQKSLDFIFENDIEKHINELSFLRKKVAEGDEAKIKLRNLEISSRKLQNVAKKRRARTVYFFFLVLCYLLYLGIVSSVILGIYALRGKEDTPLAFISSYFTIVPIVIAILPAIKLRKLAVKKLRSFRRGYYVRLLNI